MHKISAVVVDLDGTLITSRGDVCGSDLKTAERLGEEGIKLIIATGRHICFVRPCLQWLGFRNVTGIVSLNGACLIDTNSSSPWSVRYLPENQVEIFFEWISKGQYPCTVYTEELPYYRRDDRRLFEKDSAFFRNGVPLYCHGSDYGYIDELHGSLNNRILKFAVTKIPLGRLEEFRRSFRESGLCIYERKDGTFSAEIQPYGVNKLKGLESAGRRYGFSLKNVLAVGDSNNDIDMLSSAGRAAVPSDAELLDGVIDRWKDGTASLLGRSVFIAADHDNGPLASAVEHFSSLLF